MSTKWIKSTQGELELFNNRDQWLKTDSAIDRIVETMSPHSEVYFSDLCPIFSFEIFDLENLNLFKAVHLRDGAATLIDFYLKYPEPNQLRTKVYVEKSLFSLTPKAWMNHVVPVELVTTKHSKRDNSYYITGDTFEDFDEIKIKKLIDIGVTHIEVIPTTFSSQDQKSRAEIGSKFINLAKKLKENFKGVDIKFISPEEIDKSKVKEFYVETSLGVSVYCSDSYLIHYLLGLGACLTTNMTCEFSKINMIGPDYGVIISNISHDEIRANHTWRLIKQLGINSCDISNLDKLNAQLVDFINTDKVRIAKDYLKGNY